MFSSIGLSSILWMRGTGSFSFVWSTHLYLSSLPTLSCFPLALTSCLIVRVDAGRGRGSEQRLHKPHRIFPKWMGFTADCSKCRFLFQQLLKSGVLKESSFFACINLMLFGLFNQSFPHLPSHLQKKGPPYPSAGWTRPRELLIAQNFGAQAAHRAAPPWPVWHHPLHLDSRLWTQPWM